MNADPTDTPPSMTSAAEPSPTIPLAPRLPVRRIRIGLGVTLVGFLLFLLGSRPSLFGLDRSPVVGFVQIAVLLIGLAIICLGGYMAVIGLWNTQARSIAADIGVR